MTDLNPIRFPEQQHGQDLAGERIPRGLSLSDLASPDRDYPFDSSAGRGSSFRLFDFEHQLRALDVPANVFNPTDPWAKTFREGLSMLQLEPNSVGVEVGVGFGCNVAMLLKMHPTLTVYGTDIVPEATRLAQGTVHDLVGARDATRFIALHGSWDLLEGIPEELGRCDLVFGCIPQVKFPIDESLPVDAVAHYYREKRELLTDSHYQNLYAKYDRWELGLNARLLHQASHLLKPGGQVVLNLAGRVPLEVLNEMLDDYGFNPTLVHEAFIQQHAKTSLAPLARDERDNPGKSYVFFSSTDQESEPINAQLARLLQEHHKDVYHKLYVLKGDLRSSI